MSSVRGRFRSGIQPRKVRAVTTAGPLTEGRYASGGKRRTRGSGSSIREQPATREEGVMVLHLNPRLRFGAICTRAGWWMVVAG